jgi:hypothetical protein
MGYIKMVCGATIQYENENIQKLFEYLLKQDCFPEFLQIEYKDGSYNIINGKNISFITTKDLGGTIRELFKNI